MGLALLVALPTGRYLLRAAYEEARILARRQPISVLVGDSSVDDTTRAKLRLVSDARAYAAESLGLDAGESFTTYTALDRDTLVLVLSAAYQDRLAFRRWWFPVVGRVPYKGYFDFEAARREETRIATLGFDTRLRPASAFSTLGWFNDPLMSTTLRADSVSLANTVIHEILHNEFYAAGQAEFNESFANFVGARGSAEFFRRRGSAAAAAAAEARWNDEKLLAVFWRHLYGEIDSVFKAHPGDSLRPRRLSLRDSVYGAARARLMNEVGPRLRAYSTEGLERVRLDNATVLSGRIYQTDLDVFDSVFVREGRDVRRAVDRVLSIARGNPRPFGALKAWLGLAP